FEYDENGNIAKHSKVDENLLTQLNQISFYKKQPPKSLGTEWLEANFFPILEQSNLKPEIIIATCTKHFAQQIALQFKVNSKILVTGGGAFNSYLISEIEKLTDSEIIIPESELVDYKEALIFAFLGILKIRNEINVLSSVTGAKKDHSSGRIFRV
ncbi:MAG: anhydro-N-acetylmuramic acid kinase, partial [Psychroflexus sp.]